MGPLVVILLVSLGPVLVSVLTAIIAVRSNARRRAHHAAPLTAPTADVVSGRSAH